MEASALPAPAGLARARISVSAPLLRLRSDDQLLASFRSGNDDAFRVIHDRYRQRLYAYTRQMMPGSAQDAEDALQDVFIRAYSGLRANSRKLALRPWLYRVAHNRCVDELRRPVPPAPEVLHQALTPTHDPATRAEQRESLQRLIADLRRLPDHQRSALLMRELGGMSYADVAAAMDVSVPAVKSLLVRARIGLALAAEARDTACVEIRDEITLAHDRGVRPSGTVRRHLADCGGCREFRAAVRGSRPQFAALLPALGPMGLLAKVLGIGGGGAAGGGAGAAATGSASATTGAVIGGGTAAGTLAGASHVATLIAAAVVTAGGAVALQHTIAPTHHRHAIHSRAVVAAATSSAVAPARYQDQTSSYQAPASSPSPSPSSSSWEKSPPAKAPSTKTGGVGSDSASSTSVSGGDNIVPTAGPPGGTSGVTGTAPGTAGSTSSGPVTATGTHATIGTSGAVPTPAGTTTSTGTAASTGPSSTSGSGTAGTTTMSAGSSQSTSGTAPPSATTATASGPTKSAAAGTTTGTQTRA